MHTMTRTTLVAVALLSACGGGGTATLTDAQNYRYTGDMTIPSITTASGVDLTIGWDAVAEDIQCHDLDPSDDIDLLSLIRFPSLSQDEVEQGISEDTLTQAQLDGYISVEVGEETESHLVDFSFFGTPVDVPTEYFEGGGTYLLMAATGTEVGQGTRLLTFLEPSKASKETEVTLTDGCGQLDFQGDLASAETIEVGTDPAVTIDWAALTTNGIGNPLLQAKIDRVEVGHYAGLSLTDIESQFLDLELIADAWYTLDLPAVTTTADLSELRTAEGEAIDAFTTDGVWLLALRCTTCSNPAPLFLGALSVSGD